MIHAFLERAVFSPSRYGNNRRRAGVAFDNVGLDHGFQIHLVPCFRGLFEHQVQILRVGDYLSSRLGPLPQNTRQDNHGLPGDIVMDSGDYRVIQRQFGVRYLPLKRPRSLFGTLAINEPADVIRIVLESEWQILGDAHRPCVIVGSDEHDGTFP